MEDLTHIAGSSIVIKKKTTKGRQKIDLSKKIENPNKLQVAFSKRRTGLFKKASELCVLTGAQIAILTNSPGGRIFTFGHPNVDLLIDRYLDVKNNNHNTEEATQCFPSPRYEVNQDFYVDVLKKLEEEKRRKETSSLLWFEQPIDGMNLQELEEYLHSLVGFKNNVETRADELMMTNTTPRFLGPNVVDLGLMNGFPTMGVPPNADVHSGFELQHVEKSKTLCSNV